MKLIAPLIFLLLIACSYYTEQPDEKVIDRIPTIADSAKMDILTELITVSMQDSSIINKNQQLDTLLRYVDIYKDSVDKLKDVRKLVLRIHNTNTIAIDSLKLIKLENTQVKKELKKVNYQYSVSNTKLVIAQKEADNLKKKFSSPSVAGVSVKCYGFKTRFLKAPLPFETLTAKDIKRIVIKFIVPRNELIEKKKYAFGIKISGILNKSIPVVLTGEEFPIDPITFDIIDVVKPGEHIVTIDCNGKNEYTQTLNFK